ncbi:MAG: hypothetical protein OD811_06520 [Alphaproteobacteria bacterium]
MAAGTARKDRGGVPLQIKRMICKSHSSQPINGTSERCDMPQSFRNKKQTHSIRQKLSTPLQLKSLIGKSYSSQPINGTSRECVHTSTFQELKTKK